MVSILLLNSVTALLSSKLIFFYGSSCTNLFYVMILQKCGSIRLFYIVGDLLFKGLTSRKKAFLVIWRSVSVKRECDPRGLIILKVDYSLVIRRRLGTRHSRRSPIHHQMILEDVDKCVVRGKWHARLPVPPLSTRAVSPAGVVFWSILPSRIEIAIE